MSTHTGTRKADARHAVSAEEVDEQVTVRRNIVLSGVVAGLALLFAASFLIRASGFLDVLLGLVLLVVAAVNLPAVILGRTPVLVADPHGVRLRVGLGWRGLPWDSLRQVVVESSSSPLRDGRLVLVPRDRDALQRRLDPLAERHLRWNSYFYGASLSIPLGITTIVDSEDLAADLAELAAGRVEIVGEDRAEFRYEPEPAVAETPSRLTFNDEGRPIPDEDGEVGEIAPFASYNAVEDVVVCPPEETVEVQMLLEDESLDEPEPELEPEPEPELRLPEPVLPLREISHPSRVDVRLEVEDDELDEDDQPTGEHAPVVDALNAPGWEEMPVEVVIDDLADARPPLVPVIGAKITSARELLDMSIEELSGRTRIRPHVLEAIERDDFAACGGDFYARGHLTAISRALGLSLDPLLAVYDERYAQAPINARRVFEADQGGGLSGGMRATMSGPRWSLLIGAVLSLAMVWGLARIFAGDPEQLSAAPDSSAQSAGLAGHQTPITSPKMKTTSMTVRGAFATSHVVVKDRTGKVLWSGQLGLGKDRKIIGLAPFTVSSDNAGAVSVKVKGKELGVIGTAGAAGSKAFG